MGREKRKSGRETGGGKERQAGNKSYTPERQTSRPSGPAQGQKLTKEALRDLRLMGWSKGGLLICSFSRYPSGILISAGRDSRLFKSCTDGEARALDQVTQVFLRFQNHLRSKYFCHQRQIMRFYRNGFKRLSTFFSKSKLNFTLRSHSM